MCATRQGSQRCNGVWVGRYPPMRLDGGDHTDEDDHPPRCPTPSGCAPPSRNLCCRPLTPAWCADHTAGMYYRPAAGSSWVRRLTVAFASIARLGKHPYSLRRRCRFRSPKTRVLPEEALLCIVVLGDGLLPIESCSVLSGLSGEPKCPDQVILPDLLILWGLAKGWSRSYLVCRRL
jgi:hypothetical protein